MTPEGRILKRFVEWCALRGIRLIRLALQPAVEGGWPDVLVLLRGGAPLFLEFKRPGGKPTERQAARHAELVALGYAVRVVDSLDAATAAVTQAVGARGLPASRG